MFQARRARDQVAFNLERILHLASALTIPRRMKIRVNNHLRLFADGA
jgi:hypothetical protein